MDSVLGVLSGIVFVVFGRLRGSTDACSWQGDDAILLAHAHAPCHDALPNQLYMSPKDLTQRLGMSTRSLLESFFCGFLPKQGRQNCRERFFPGS